MPHQRKKNRIKTTVNTKEEKRKTIEDRRRTSSEDSRGIRRIVEDDKSRKQKKQKKSLETRNRRILKQSAKNTLRSPSPTQRRSTQPQVSSSLDRFSFVGTSSKCSALKEKNGFIFSKEELSYWQTCQPSSFQQEHQHLRFRHSFQDSYSQEISKEKFLTTGQSSLKRLRQPNSEGKASQNNWAGCPTVHGQGVPQALGMMSQFGIQKMSTSLGKK